MGNEVKMARARYNMKTKKWNVAVNAGGAEILIGTSEGIFMKTSEWDSKKEAQNWIEDKEGLRLAKNIREMARGVRNEI